MKRNINAREAGSNKQQASKSVALSLVRQLFHLGVIEAYSGTLRRNKDVDTIKPYDVAMSPELVTEVEDVLRMLEMPPVQVIDNYSTQSVVHNGIT